MNQILLTGDEGPEKKQKEQELYLEIFNTLKNIKNKK